MNSRLGLGLCVLAIVAACASLRPKGGPLSDFDFLKGTWAQTTSRETIEEVWTANEGWSLHGVGRTLRDGREYSRGMFSIEPRGKKFVYVAELPGATPVEFVLVERGLDWARFENPAQAFPRRIEYRRKGSVLRAELSGLEHGRERREVFDYHRFNPR